MRLTRNFSSEEFDSKDGASMPNIVLKNISTLAVQLQTIRDYIDRPIKINSGYRSPAHNKSIGGVKNSQHVKGKASDIVIKGLSTSQVYRIIEQLIEDGKIIQGGLGLYKGFVHYDIRGKKARWDNR
tara:strand:+ start:2256 stop:2636 length:381 start_codon:yes stop_codon:yes gene_type:complete